MKRLFRTLAMSSAFVVSLVGASTAPASADWPAFIPLPTVPPIPDPGSCTPYVGCRFTLTTNLNNIINGYDQISQAKMMVQNLKTGISRLGGMRDPSMNQLSQLLSNAKGQSAAQNVGDAEAAAYEQNQASAQNDEQQLSNDVQQNGDSVVAAEQYNFVELQQIRGEMTAMNRMAVAQKVQTGANTAQTYRNLNELMDLNGPADMGWGF